MTEKEHELIQSPSRDEEAEVSVPQELAILPVRGVVVYPSPFKPSMSDSHARSNWWTRRRSTNR